METILQFTDPLFDLYKVQHYELSLQISLRGFSFCVYDPDHRRFIAFKSYELPFAHSDHTYRQLIEKWFTTDEMLSHPYRKVRLVWIGESSMLIPHPFYNDTLAKAYGQLTLEDNEHYLPHHYHIEEPSIDVLFNVHKHVASMASAVLYNPVIMPQAAPLIDEITDTARNINHHHLTANCIVHPHCFDFLIADASQLRFYNTFSYQQHTDILYLILNALEKNKCDTGQISISLFCHPAQSSALYDLLKKYIPGIILQKMVKNADYRFPLQTTQSIVYLPMFLSVRCG